MTNTIQHVTNLMTDAGFDGFTLIADVDTVRGEREVDLIEAHNNFTGEMWEMADWEYMLDNYDDQNGHGAAAADGILCWRELQDLVWEKGE